MATYSASSNYRSTDVIDNRYLDIMNWPLADLSTYNLVDYVVKPGQHNRPDVLANDLWGEPRLWWVIAILNQDLLQDPILDLKSGMTIKVTREIP